MNVQPASGVKPKVEPQSDFTFEEVTVKSLKDISLKIGKSPLKITAEDESIVKVFPRKGNLLFMLEGNKIKNSDISIRHKGTINPINTVPFDERKQAVINGHFSGVYVISITEESK